MLAVVAAWPEPAAASCTVTPAGRTVADLDRVGLAMLAWWTDHAAAGHPGRGRHREVPLDLAQIPPIGHGELEALLVPAYLTHLPELDGWGHAYEYRLDLLDLETPPVMSMRSTGSDGAFRGTIYAPGQNSQEDEDLVWADGFVYRRLVLPGTEQRVTVRDLMAIDQALAAWLADQPWRSASPRSQSGVCEDLLIDLGAIPVRTHAELEALLVPGYLPFVPHSDAWGWPYEYRLETATYRWAVRSAGGDGDFSGTLYGLGHAVYSWEDLVWVDGLGVRTPAPGRLEAQMSMARTMRSVGIAVLSWWTDQASRAAGPRRVRAPVDLGLYTPISAAELAALLAPRYILCVPELDVWGLPYDYWFDTEDLLGPELAAVRGRGRDGEASGEVYFAGSFPATLWDEDLVWTDGEWVRQPETAALIFHDDFERGDSCAWSD